MGEFDFSDFEAHAVERLRAVKVEPVPDVLVNLAQKSLEGIPHPHNEREKLHVLRHQFREGEEAKRDAFMKHMRNAGAHTNPVSTVSVVADPDRDGNGLLVAWRAGQKRGRKSS